MTAASWVTATVALAAFSCRPPEEPPEPETTSARAPASGAHEDGPLASVRRTAAVHMPSHFADVLEIHSALIRGAVPDARLAARELLAERPVVMLEEWSPYVYAMEDAAGRVATADDLAAASSAASELARTCGACHLALGVSLTATERAAPPADGDIASTMRRHEWAFDRLWEGLVLPSERAWSLGAAAFAELPFCPQTPSAERDDRAVEHARETLNGLVQPAREASSWNDRADVYGRMLPTCSTCHAELDACR